MNYILYEVLLKEGKLNKLYADSIESAIDIFRLHNPNRDYYTNLEYKESDFEYSKYTLEKGQGWMACDTEDKYVIIFKNEEGIFENFMSWCKEKEKVSSIVNRHRNLEHLLDK